jgi:hypothetical protein
MPAALVAELLAPARPQAEPRALAAGEPDAVFLSSVELAPAEDRSVELSERSGVVRLERELAEAAGQAVRAFDRARLHGGRLPSGGVPNPALCFSQTPRG